MNTQVILYFSLIKQRFYFDTSILGGVFDTEFDAASLQIFEKVKMEKVTCVYSDLTEGEIFEALERVKIFFKNLQTENLEVVYMNDEAIKLANSYIAENDVGKTNFRAKRYFNTSN